MPPMRDYNGHLLLDGGYVSNLPVEGLKALSPQCGTVFAVDVENKVRIQNMLQQKSAVVSLILSLMPAVRFVIRAFSMLRHCQCHVETMLQTKPHRLESAS